MMQGMMFGGEGPVMQGTWYNPKTGDSFTVRDSFFEDNQYVITTTDGRYLSYNQIQNYVQTDMKPEALKNMKNNIQNENKKEELPPEVSGLIDNEDENAYFGDNMILPEDMEMINPQKPVKLGNIHTTTSTIIKDDIIYPAPETVNTTIIKKALSNTELPKITVTVDWNNFPSKQLEMLYDIMQIPENEIVEWYLDNIQMVELVEQVQAGIKNKIVNKNNIDNNIFVDVSMDSTNNSTSKNESKEIKPKRGKRPSNK